MFEIMWLRANEQNQKARVELRTETKQQQH